MQTRITTLLSCLGLIGLAVAGCAPAESQTLRERIQDRRAARLAAPEPQEEAGATGAQALSVSVGGQERSFLVRAPASLSASPGIVLVYHGGGGNAARFFESNSMPEAADQGGFLAVFPDAGGERWNDGRDSTAGGPDDVAFARAIVARLQSEYGADPGRVFATGISNGGIMAFKLACDAPDLVAAVAPVAANMPAALAPSCAGSGVPVMMFSGVDDPLMPFGGGIPDRSPVVAMMGGEATDEMMSAEGSAEFWARRNGCGGPQSRALPDLAADGTSVVEVDWSGCAAGEVTLFEIQGGGHTWPGGAPGRRLTGATTEDLDATSAMLGFFRRQGL